MTAIDDLLKEYLALSSLPEAKVDVARFNKVKELLGEAGAQLEVAKKYGPGRLKHVSVPRRGTKGAQIFDLLYELDDGRLVMVESKYGGSLLGRTTDRHVYVVSERGAMTPLPLKKQVEQLDALWIKDRIAEIETKDPALAQRLRDAVEKERLGVLEVRTAVDVDQAGARLRSDLTDHTERFREQARSGRRFTDAERRYARREAISDLHLESAEVKATQDAKAAEQAKKKSDKAERDVKKATKDLDDAKRPQTKEKRQAILADKRKAADELKAAAREAEDAAKKSEETRKLTKRLKQQDTTLRKGEAATKRLERSLAVAARDPAPPPPIAEDAGAVKNTTLADTRTTATATADEAVANRMIEARGLGGAPAARDVLARGGGHELGQAVVKSVPRRAVFQFAAGGARVAVKTARFVFTVLDFANPVFDLLLAVDLIDSLVNWLQRDKIEERREWVRIAEFLLGTPQRIVSAYGIPYHTSIGPTINAVMEYQLANSSYPSNFLFWLGKWNTERAWRGFVYPQIDIELERQNADSDAAYSVKYYMSGPIAISLVDRPQTNARQEAFIARVGPQDERNLSTHGGEARYDPQHNIVVEISDVKVRFTPARPILTPFDFMIVKCRHLVSEIVTFISQYDNAVIDGMNVREEIMTDVNGKWAQWHEFPAPLNSPQIHFCLRWIFQALDALEAHAGRKNDFDNVDQFNRGYYRRLEILRQLASPPREFAGTKSAGKRLFYEVGSQLGLIATGGRRGSSIPEDLTYLRELALRIDDDVVRAFKDCRKSPVSLEYNYQGKSGAEAVVRR
jgi:flagellar biosynthesis GTPase FlhF